MTDLLATKLLKMMTTPKTTPKTTRNKRAIASLKLATMPHTPTVGLVFNPDKTDALGIIERVDKNLGKITVTYHYTHEPNVKHTRPYAEVERMAWKVVS